MHLRKIQGDVDRWTSQFNPQYWEPLEVMSRLTEETGELAREINHRFGPKKKKSSEEKREIADEICDILFTLSCLANSQRIDLDKAWNSAMSKHYKRDNKRFKRKN